MLDQQENDITNIPEVGRPGEAELGDGYQCSMFLLPFCTPILSMWLSSMVTLMAKILPLRL